MRKLTLDNYIKEKLKDPRFRKEWEKSEAQYQITRQLIAARMENGLSQRKLAQKAKTTQAVISRIENMSTKPSLGILERLAWVLGKRIEVNLVGN
jgi:ribosome-binding protein aMBF1 (putative translation factor)